MVGGLALKHDLSPFANSAFASVPTETPLSPLFGALPFTQAMLRADSLTRTPNLMAALSLVQMAHANETQQNLNPALVAAYPAGTWGPLKAAPRPRRLRYGFIQTGLSRIRTRCGLSMARCRPSCCSAATLHRQVLCSSPMTSSCSKTGCMACYSIGGRDKIGPDLFGITETCTTEARNRPALAAAAQPDLMGESDSSEGLLSARQPAKFESLDKQFKQHTKEAK